VGDYAVLPDGQRFLVNSVTGGHTIRVVLSRGLARDARICCSVCHPQNLTPT